MLLEKPQCKLKFRYDFFMYSQPYHSMGTLPEAQSTPEKLPYVKSRRTFTHKPQKRYSIYDTFSIKKARNLIIPGLDDDIFASPKYSVVGSDGSPSRGIERFSLADNDSLRSPEKFWKSPALSEIEFVGDVGNLSTFFNILTAFLGASILTLPSTFQTVGLVGGCIGMVVVSTIVCYTMRLQIYAKNKLAYPINSYIEMSRSCLSQREIQLTEFCLLTSQLGFFVAKFIFMGNQFEKIICHNLKYCNLKNYYIAISAFIVIPICWLRSYKYLSYFTLASNVILVLCLCIIMKYCIQNHFENPEVSNDLNYFIPENFPLFFGVAVFILEGNGLIIGIHSTMKRP